MAQYGYTYDYTRVMMMKLGLSFPDKKGNGSIVENTFDDALNIIKTVDNLTQGITKIIYLVGWQYNGHDDKYPDFFEVNEALKRKEDESAYDSLLWLMAEAKKYNTVVSFHINFNDAYENAPSFNEFVINNALIRKKSGKPWAIERYNGKKCYKTSFVEYWESGLFRRQVDRLLELFPIQEQGTLHVDNFQCYSNYAPYIAISKMQKYRDKMIGYLREKVIDITTEFTCREHDKLRNKTLFGTPRDHRPDMPIDILGKIPAVWWLTYLSNKELVDIPPQLLSGGMLRNGTKVDNRDKFIYGNMHGEDLFPKRNTFIKEDWHKDFLRSFATVQVPYNFLCEHRRLAIEGSKGEYLCKYTDDIVSYEKGGVITYNSRIVKEGDNLCIPFVLKKDCYLAYSGTGDKRFWKITGNYSSAKIYRITPHGNEYLYENEVRDNSLELNIAKEEGLFITLR